MFEQPGIGLEDLAWIHRDQFVHYVQMAHALGDLEDWPRLRRDLLQALTAAFGLAPPLPMSSRRDSTARCRSSTRSAVRTTPRPTGRGSSRSSGVDGMTYAPTSP